MGGGSEGLAPSNSTHSTPRALPFSSPPNPEAGLGGEAPRDEGLVLLRRGTRRDPHPRAVPPLGLGAASGSRSSRSLELRERTGKAGWAGRGTGG